MKKLYRQIAVFLCAALLLTGCSAGPREAASTELGTAEKCILLVLDGFSSSYLQKLGPSSNFAKIARAGACCLTAESVYPTHTCTNHATIMTGLSAGGHGIIGNVRLAEDGKSSEKNIQPEMLTAVTLFQLAKQAGRKTAVVSGKNNMVTLFSADLDVGVSNLRTLDYLTEAPVLTESENNDEYYRYNLDLADWVFLSLQTVLETEQPDLTLVNIQSADYIGHRFGPDSKELKTCIKRLDKALGKLYAFLEKAGMLETTAVLLTADHGMTASSRAIPLNTLIYGNFPAAGAVIDGRNGYLWAGDEDRDALVEFFRDCEGVGEILVKGSDRARELRVDCDAQPDIILNAQDGYVFLPEPMIHLYRGQHGSLSDSDRLVPLVWFGAGIPAGAGIEATDLRSVAPMVCQLMDLPTAAFELEVPQLTATQDLTAFG